MESPRSPRRALSCAAKRSVSASSSAVTAISSPALTRSKSSQARMCSFYARSNFVAAISATARRNPRPSTKSRHSAKVENSTLLTPPGVGHDATSGPSDGSRASAMDSRQSDGRGMGRSSVDGM